MYDITPDTDGINHINIYSKGRTELGRKLSNFSNIGFIHDTYGYFASVEAFWYWLKTGLCHNNLRHTYGYNAKKLGKQYTKVYKDNFNEEILEAIRCKLRQNPELLHSLTDSNLPLKHYYAYGNSSDGYKIVELPQYQWMINEFDRIRTLMKNYAI